MFFAKIRLAENMDLSPSRQDFTVLLAMPPAQAKTLPLYFAVTRAAVRLELVCPEVKR